MGDHVFTITRSCTKRPNVRNLETTRRHKRSGFCLKQRTKDDMFTIWAVSKIPGKVGSPTAALADALKRAEQKSGRAKSSATSEL